MKVFSNQYLSSGNYSLLKDSMAYGLLCFSLFIITTKAVAASIKYTGNPNVLSIEEKAAMLLLFPLWIAAWFALTIQRRGYYAR